MAGYDHHFGYKNTKVHSSADGLSRLPLKTKERAEKVVHAVNVFNMKQLEPLPDRLKTSKEKPMRWWVKDGYVPILNPFYPRREVRVILPPKLCPQASEELHRGHLGGMKIKALPRRYIWWPGIHKEIEEAARTC